MQQRWYIRRLRINRAGYQWARRQPDITRACALINGYRFPGVTNVRGCT